MDGWVADVSGAGEVGDASVAELNTQTTGNKRTKPTTHQQRKQSNGTAAKLFVSTDFKPFKAHCCHMGTAIKHPVPDRVEPSFVIFDIRVLWRSGWASEYPYVKNYKWKIKLQTSVQVFTKYWWILQYYISQGSVATQLRCGGMFCNHFTASLPSLPTEFCDSAFLLVPHSVIRAKLDFADFTKLLIQSSLTQI